MRVFVAVWPPPSVVAVLRALDRPQSDGVRWTSEHQWHVTLRFLGEVEDPDAVTARLEGLEGGRTTARLGPTSAPLGPGILCLPVTGLDGLAAAVITATADLGQPPEHRRFRGHMTLARARRGATVRALRGMEADASWRVEEVTVVASVLGSKGSRYEVVGAVALS